MSDERKLWERQPEDTPKSWAAFCVYRDLGADRSITKAYQIDVSRKYPDRTRPEEANKRWKIWASGFNWVARTAAYDAHLDALDRAQFEKDRLKAREERRKLIRAAKGKLATMLNNMTTEDPKTGEVVSMMQLVLREERAEYNDEPTQRFEHSGPEGSPIQVDVIDEALRKIYGEQQEDEQDDD